MFYQLSPSLLRAHLCFIKLVDCMLMETLSLFSDLLKVPVIDFFGVFFVVFF